MAKSVQARVRKALKKYVRKATNPKKTVSLKNFTGRITRNKNGTVTIKGKGKASK
jgi:hypothetical protein